MKSFVLNNSSSKIIQLSGRTDGHEERELGKELEDVSGFNEIILDFSSVAYLSGGLLNVLRDLAEGRSGINGKVKIINPCETVRKTLETDRMLQAFEVRNIFPTAW